MRRLATGAARPAGPERPNPCANRTSRERANPHGDNRSEQAGHASSPAASAASTNSGVIAIESIEDRWFGHGR